jgi:hypothetical protein
MDISTLLGIAVAFLALVVGLYLLGRLARGRQQSHPALTLPEKVAAAVAAEREGSMICGLEAFYWPHGGKDELWITLRLKGGSIARTRTFYEGQPVRVTRALDANTSAAVRAELGRLGVWDLADSMQPVIDGFRCTLVAADQKRQHVIEMHNPGDEHLKLVDYLLGLARLPEEADS